MKEAKEHKPLVDKLNELSSSLLDLIPWHTREGLDRMVTEDNERYRAFCDAAAQQVEQMDADLLKSQQVNYSFDISDYLFIFLHSHNPFCSRFLFFCTSLNKLQTLNSPG